MNEDVDTGFETRYFDDALSQGLQFGGNFQIVYLPASELGAIENEAQQQTLRDLEAPSAWYNLDLPTLGADVARVQRAPLQETGFNIDAPRAGHGYA